MTRREACDERISPSETSLERFKGNRNSMEAKNRSMRTSEDSTLDSKPVLADQGGTRKHRRQFSATPQPETPTRLRTVIKPTPGGHGLARISEKRRAQREQTCAQADLDTRDSSPRNGGDDYACNAVPRSPLTNIEARRSPSQSQVLPRPGVKYPTPSRSFYQHPKYSFGWMPHQSYSLPMYHSNPLEDASAPTQTVNPVSATWSESRRPSSKTTPALRVDVEESSPWLASPSEVTMDTPEPVDSGTTESDSSPTATRVFRQRSGSIATGETQKNLEQKHDILSTEATNASRGHNLSAEGADALVRGLVDLDILIKTISASTGIEPQEILRQSQRADWLEVDLFDIYRNYFLAQQPRELDRLPQGSKARGFDGAIPIGTVRAAYEVFQKYVPHYASFLRRWWHVHKMFLEDVIPNTRQDAFDQYTAMLRGLAQHASTSFGFETIFWTVGSDIQQDQSLSRAYHSCLIGDFFHNRLGISDSEVEVHLKAHVYDQVSRKNLVNNPRRQRDLTRDLPPEADHRPAIPTFQDRPKLEADDQQLMDNTDNHSITISHTLPSSIPPELTVPQESECMPLDRTHSASDATELTLKKTTPVKQRVINLKNGFSNLTKDCNIPQLLKQNIQLANMPVLLAKNGWVLENWPEDVEFPCELKTGKGLAGLTVTDQIALLKSLNDPFFPLKVSKKSHEAIPSSEPVIFGAPPSPDSEHLRGRRRFLDKAKTTDRNGPPRQIQRSEENLASQAAGGDRVAGHNDSQRVSSIKRPLEKSEESEQLTCKRARAAASVSTPIDPTEDAVVANGDQRSNKGESRGNGTHPPASLCKNSKGKDIGTQEREWSSEVISSDEEGETNEDFQSDNRCNQEIATDVKNSNPKEQAVPAWYPGYPIQPAGQYPPPWGQQVIPFQLDRQAMSYGPGLPPFLQYLPHQMQGYPAVPGNIQAPFPPFRVPGDYGRRGPEMSPHPS